MRPNEKKASFKIETTGYAWWDYGLPGGGNIIDLCMLINNTDTKGALSILENTNLSSKSFFSEQQKTIAPPQNQINIKNTQPIRNKALIQYLNKRKIPLEYAKKYISEVHYKTPTGKPVYSLAFENDKGGYELRSEIWQGGTSPKYFTTIKIKNSTSINIFESFFDFLSALVYFRTYKPNHTTIILNSLNFKEQTIDIIKIYKKVNLFLDNDNVNGGDAGERAVEFYKDHHNKIINQSLRIYPKHKDFNAFLTS